ncbi:phosphoribosylamine--glycine ligase [Pseudoflavonifractor phocaeensis]|uniref:phosphoribosylamine--glycine ligase n=1 Tax=Pseudoflavonifractor phocaeensis TaxID=1870988 RepID=UPI00195984FF|nr:phosphoribosylamine--glycine ligase [Pseudoflavonifractor phocaeensis]MBM6871204.1 phosphoribosylamine--glycine ligase [Pseudoflavonifractor phocaeensis]
MKVLVVGGGGREHAICWKLAQSPKVSQLFCAPGNAGIAQAASCVPVKATDVEGMVAWAKENHMDFVMVAPDDPLALGMVDAMEAAGIPAFGPRANAAVIEASKIFSKHLMEKHHIPTARYRDFTELAPAEEYIRRQGAPIVVKADGLALGKGVVVAQTVDEALAAVREMMAGGKFGASGSKVVIEECMTGPEVTVLAFCDGKHVVPMPSSQDHKRAYDGNQGPNTGGMGAISPSPNYTPEVARQCMEEIFLPTVAALQAEGRPFQGVLYFGLMLTPNGPKVVEYNARFGDPECQAVLSLLESDLMDILMACRSGNLDQLDIRWKDGAACCLVLASGGYPGSYQKGLPITGLDEAGRTAVVFHAGTAEQDGQIVTNGGRVLGVTAVGPSLSDAIDLAYESAKPIHFDAMHFRTDIGRV